MIKGRVNKYTDAYEYTYEGSNSVPTLRRGSGGSSIRWTVIKDLDTDCAFKPGAQIAHMELHIMLRMKCICPGSVLIDRITGKKHRVIICDDGVYELSPKVVMRSWGRWTPYRSTQ